MCPSSLEDFVASLNELSEHIIQRGNGTSLQAGSSASPSFKLLDYFLNIIRFSFSPPCSFSWCLARTAGAQNCYQGRVSAVPLFSVVIRIKTSKIFNFFAHYESITILLESENKIKKN